MKQLKPIASILLIVGGLNWGLIGLGWLVGGGADWNVVNVLLGAWPQLEGVVYVLVGLSGAWALLDWKKNM
jgi:uncharacterized membrane protein YuzA (DUF378 family)